MRVSEGRWQWADGTRMPLPNNPRSFWYGGQPDGTAQNEEDCTILTNYKFWASPKLSLSSFYWADHSCDTNANDVQGFICESK